jgi:hypothetical protein
VVVVVVVVAAVVVLYTIHRNDLETIAEMTHSLIKLGR